MTVWKKYSLGIVLVVMFLVTWALMTWTDWVSFAAQQAEHHQQADVFGASGYISQWATLTIENWQSDIMGYAVTVILGAYLLYKGSRRRARATTRSNKGCSASSRR